MPHNKGQAGETRRYVLTLKSIADVGLVGYPNAGKSSILCALSKAKPKVAGYKFTTLYPTVGKVIFPDYYDFSVADIPGLVDGAHANRGLGHQFLRHIQRTKVMLYVLDCSGWEEERSDPVKDLVALQNEIRIFDPTLCDRPALVCANKIDLKTSKPLLRALRRASEMPVIGVSAKTGENIPQLAQNLRVILQELERERKAKEEEDREEPEWTKEEEYM
jgi:GTP-binding protein